MTTWLVCTMDDGILSEHRTKRAAVDAVVRREGWVQPRRLRAGEYEYTGPIVRGSVTSYYVMTEDGARRNGWERAISE